MKEKTKNTVLIIFALFLTCLMACVDEPPKETQSPEVASEHLEEIEKEKEAINMPGVGHFSTVNVSQFV